MWYKNGLEVEESPNLILAVDGAQRILLIPLTTVEDTGEYICDTEDDSMAFLVTITGKNGRVFVPCFSMNYSSICTLTSSRFTYYHVNTG